MLDSHRRVGAVGRKGVEVRRASDQFVASEEVFESLDIRVKLLLALEFSGSDRRKPLAFQRIHLLLLRGVERLAQACTSNSW